VRSEPSGSPRHSPGIPAGDPDRADARLSPAVESSTDTRRTRAVHGRHRLHAGRLAGRLRISRPVSGRLLQHHHPCPRLRSHPPTVVPGWEATARESQSVNIQGLSPGSFRALGAPPLAGREFARTDTADSRRVAIINQAFIREFLPGVATPLGRIVELPQPAEI